MKRVFVTVGPRAVGKTTFCKQVIQDTPEVVLISRDDIATELFGTISLDPYTGEYQFLYIETMRRVEELLSANENSLVILDAWNGFASDRRKMAKQLRSQGADWIEAWQFVTPEDLCVRWFLEREEPKDAFWAKVKADHCRLDYRFYHSHLVELAQGFDAIYKVDPLQLSCLPFVLS